MSAHRGDFNETKCMQFLIKMKKYQKNIMACGKKSGMLYIMKKKKKTKIKVYNKKNKHGFPW